MELSVSKRIHLSLETPRLSLYPGDNEDVVGNILTFCDPPALGAITTTCAGAWAECGKDKYWGRHVERLSAVIRKLEERRGRDFSWPHYPEGTPQKKLYAAILYGYIHYRREGSWHPVRTPWNITSSLEVLRRLEAAAEYMESISEGRKRERASAEKSLATARRKLKCALYAGLEAPAREGGRDLAVAMVRIQGLGGQISRLESLMADLAIAGRRAVRGVVHVHRRVGDMRESERLHEVFTPYLRYYWLYGQRMHDEPSHNFSGYPWPREESTHAMQLRGAI